MTKPQNPSCPQNANLQNQQKQSNNNRSAQTNKETNKQKATKENERECAPELSRNKNVHSKTATDETVGFVPNEMICPTSEDSYTSSSKQLVYLNFALSHPGLAYIILN